MGKVDYREKNVRERSEESNVVGKIERKRSRRRGRSRNAVLRTKVGM